MIDLKKEVKRVYGLLWFNMAEEDYLDEVWVEQPHPDYKGCWHLDKYVPLKSNYYDRGLIAASLSKRAIAKKLRCSEITVNKAVKILVKRGWVRIEKSNNNQNVYILGTHINGMIDLFKNKENLGER